MDRKRIVARTGRAERTEQAATDWRRKGFFSSLIICSLVFAACNGNGGSVDSWGEVYNPNGTPVSSGSSGGTVPILLGKSGPPAFPTAQPECFLPCRAGVYYCARPVFNTKKHFFQNFPKIPGNALKFCALYSIFVLYSVL